MRPVLDIKPIAVAAGSIHRLEAAKGLQVTAVAGTIWLTQAMDPRDVILTRGQSFILDRDGVAVAYALRDSAIVIGPAGHVTAAGFAAPTA